MHSSAAARCPPACPLSRPSPPPTLVVGAAAVQGGLDHAAALAQVLLGPGQEQLVRVGRAALKLHVADAQVGHPRRHVHRHQRLAACGARRQGGARRQAVLGG